MDILDDILGEDNPEFMTIEQLKKSIGWPLPYVSTMGIAPYIRRLGPDLIGLEVGTGRGEGAVYLVEQCPNIKVLHTIDPYKEYQDWNGIVSQDALDRHKQIALENFKKFPQISYNDIPGDEIDFLFIDGDHSSKSVYADLDIFYHGVRKNGIVAGSSYGIASVKEGLKKWQTDTKNRYPITVSTNNVWYFYKR